MVALPLPASDERLSLTGRRWLWPRATLGPERAAPGELEGWVRALLERRGITGEAAVRAYLSPSLASLEDPASMADMAAAVAVLERALRERLPITVYGDYDVDGVCSTALLVELLGALGADVRYYIPDRRGEGYGLNEAAVRDICASARVLVTTDCGITAVREVGIARSLGCEVVVVDHHRPSEALPAATACLDPHRPDCPFPSKVLCAAGVAFMLAVALRRSLRDHGFFAGRAEPDLRVLLDLVAVATVADMVPLSGQNRVLVAAGLKRLALAPRPGLLALLEVSEVAPASVCAADLAFRVGPRVNARGRLSHAAEAVELMLTADVARARTLAAALDVANRERRDVEKATTAAAMAAVEREGLLASAALVVSDPSWHAGVVGLVASRLVAAHHRPAVVIGEGGKGSARSILGLDIHACISEASGALVRFGGHAAAAGVTVAGEAQVDELRGALDRAVRSRLGPPPYVPVLEPDLAVQPAALSLGLVDAALRLAPFGQENPEPLWALAGVPVRSTRLVGKDHLKLVLGDERLEAIAFGMGHLRDGLPAVVDAVFRLERNRYGGRETLQLRIEDLRGAAAPSP